MDRFKNSITTKLIMQFLSCNYCKYYYRYIKINMLNIKENYNNANT
jgi:hypothetical protein